MQNSINESVKLYAYRTVHLHKWKKWINMHILH